VHVGGIGLPSFFCGLHLKKRMLDIKGAQQLASLVHLAHVHPWLQAHKKAVKEANREKRKHKTPKHVKKAHKAGKKK